MDESRRKNKKQIPCGNDKQNRRERPGFVHPTRPQSARTDGAPARCPLDRAEDLVGQLWRQPTLCDEAAKGWGHPALRLEWTDCHSMKRDA